MKHKYKILLWWALIFLAGTAIVYGQDRITIQGVQDFKMAFVGDDKGNDPFTANFVVRASFEGYDKPTGYSAVIMEYEYADLAGGLYQRWSAGYAHNWNVGRFIITPSAQFGFIERNGATMTGIFTGDLSYQLFDGFYIVGSGQITIRTDLKDSPWRLSNFVGIRVKVI